MDKNSVFRRAIENLTYHPQQQHHHHHHRCWKKQGPTMPVVRKQQARSRPTLAIAGAVVALSQQLLNNSSIGAAPPPRRQKEQLHNIILLLQPRHLKCRLCVAWHRFLPGGSDPPQQDFFSHPHLLAPPLPPFIISESPSSPHQLD